MPALEYHAPSRSGRLYLLLYRSLGHVTDTQVVGEVPAILGLWRCSRFLAPFFGARRATHSPRIEATAPDRIFSYYFSELANKSGCPYRAT